MHWHRRTTLAALFLAWIVLALWQWQEYQAECDSARDALRRQAESVANALIGGIQSHRRFGRFIEAQLQGALDELAKSQDILAVAVLSSDAKILLGSGNTKDVDLSEPITPGVSWKASGLSYTEAFQLAPEPTGPGGMGPGRGAGWGRGGPGGNPGVAPGWAAEPPNRSPLAQGGRFFVAILLDRSKTDQTITHYAWIRAFVVAAGALVILSVAMAWQATMRLADARGRAQLLETESRHLGELSQAATGLAHETRNPLGLIRGWAQRWMHALPDDSQLRQQVKTVIEECDRVTARINQFLAFARPCKPKIAPVHPSEVIAELASLLEPDLDAKHLTLKSTPAQYDKPVEADREMLRQALFNLLQNAVEFSPEGETIAIELKNSEDGTTTVEVADRGPGVAAENVELLFTPYHTTRSNGTGLGLAIVRQIASAHGWTAGYSPRPGGGSIFWLKGLHG